ncbi:MAG: hypothetical protein ACRELA_07795 [Candidatus Rokuibacteriota bacterium]
MIDVPVPDPDFIVELSVEPTWIPKLTMNHTDDVRELGVGRARSGGPAAQKPPGDWAGGEEPGPPALAPARIAR